MKKKLLKKLGKRIRKIRLQKGLTQTELANSLDKDQPSVQRLEKGNINPSIYYLHEIASGLEIKLSELFEGL